MFCVLVNNTNDILILLLSISVWVKFISQILKPNCREKEFLEFFRNSDIPVPPPDIPSQPQILAKSSSEVALTSIGKSARKFQGPGYSGSPTGYSEATSGKLLSQDSEVALTSIGKSARRFQGPDIPVHQPDIPGQPQENWLSQESEVALTPTGNSARKFQGLGYSESTSENRLSQVQNWF